MSTIALPARSAQRFSSGAQTRTQSPALPAAVGKKSQSSYMKKVKLTRRGRFVLRGLPLLTLAALIVLGALTVISPFEAKAGDSSPAAAVQMVTVKGGQTLWDIAQEADPHADTRDVINQIMQLNGLKATNIEAGQTLQIPVYSAK